LPLEKRFGHAVYTLIAKVARGQCFADPNQMALFLVDEAHHLLGADDGVDIVEDFVLQGRKSSAAVGLGDQDCAFGTPKLRGLIKTRIAHRHTDETLAKRAIEWLGLDPDDYGLVKQYMEQTAPVTGKDKYVEPHRRGEGYMRDGSGNVGRIKTLLPATESRRSAVSTTPKDNKQGKA
ncbi:ATP-binding protein, partial [Streptomyces sp. NPDC058171]